MHQSMSRQFLTGVFCLAILSACENPEDPDTDSLGEPELRYSLKSKVGLNGHVLDDSTGSGIGLIPVAAKILSYDPAGEVFKNNDIPEWFATFTSGHLLTQGEFYLRVPRGYELQRYRDGVLEATIADVDFSYIVLVNRDDAGQTVNSTYRQDSLQVTAAGDQQVVVRLLRIP